MEYVVALLNFEEFDCMLTKNYNSFSYEVTSYPKHDSVENDQSKHLALEIAHQQDYSPTGGKKRGLKNFTVAKSRFGSLHLLGFRERVMH